MSFILKPPENHLYGCDTYTQNAPPVDRQTLKKSEPLLKS
nr:MAG TPA: hypothetical protein [Caudoviricetes sp.]